MLDRSAPSHVPRGAALRAALGALLVLLRAGAAAALAFAAVLGVVVPVLGGVLTRSGAPEWGIFSAIAAVLALAVVVAGTATAPRHHRGWVAGALFGLGALAALRLAPSVGASPYHALTTYAAACVGGALGLAATAPHTGRARRLLATAPLLPPVAVAGAAVVYFAPPAYGHPAWVTLPRGEVVRARTAFLRRTGAVRALAPASRWTDDALLLLVAERHAAAVSRAAGGGRLLVETDPGSGPGTYRARRLEVRPLEAALDPLLRAALRATVRSEAASGAIPRVLGGAPLPGRPLDGVAVFELVATP